jgi:Holliday junction resolvasome RuvABC endonuclease subunit
MKIISIDPGAKRCGWAVLEGDGLETPERINSGVFGVDRGNETYHSYRLKVIEEFSFWSEDLMRQVNPSVVVSEILPVRGFNNMSQALLAAAAITAVQTIAFQRQHVVSQLAAVTVKLKIGGSGKATKVKVRNGVNALLPEWDFDFKQTSFDETDAIAVGLAYLGYTLQA